MLTNNPGRSQLTVDDQDFEVLWQDQGETQRLTVFKDGLRLGVKEFPHTIDQGLGVLVYAVRSIVKQKSSLSN